MTVGTIIGIIGTVIGIIGGLYGMYNSSKANNRNLSADSEDDGREIGQILTDLGYIKLTLDEIKTKVNMQDQRHIDIVSKLAILESFKEMVEKNFSSDEARFKSIEDEISKIKDQLSKLNI